MSKLIKQENGFEDLLPGLTIDKRLQKHVEKKTEGRKPRYFNDLSKDISAVYSVQNPMFNAIGTG